MPTILFETEAVLVSLVITGREKMEEGDCKYCGFVTKHRCLKCESFVWNTNLECIGILFWMESWRTSSAQQGMRSKRVYRDNETNNDIASFKVDCASRGYHVYRRLWKPKLNEKLEVGIDKDNVYDPYACGIYKYSKEVISGKILIGHIPRELPRFCKFFLDYGGKLEATVRCAKYRRSPPQGGLEIPVTLLIFKDDSSDDVYSKMQELVANNYIEPEKIPVIDKKKDDSDIELLL